MYNFGNPFYQQQKREREQSEYERKRQELMDREPILDDNVWTSLLGADGMLKPQYQMTDQLDTRALDAMRSEGLRDAGTQSQWASLMLQGLGNDQARAMDQTAAQTAGLQAQQMAQMGAMGGYDRGAMERMGRTSFRDMLRQKQNNRSEFANRRLDVMKQDEQNRLSSLNNLNNAEMGRANYLGGIQQANNQGALSEIGAKREFDMNKFDINSKRWASEMDSLASTEAAKKSACFRGDTLIDMQDGSTMRIEDIEIGDVLKGHVEVLGVHHFKMKNTDTLYNYKGVFVTGEHAVFDTGEFRRVKDCRASVIQTENIPKTVYNLTTKTHTIPVGSYTFADYEEVDVDVAPKVALAMMNKKAVAAVA